MKHYIPYLFFVLFAVGIQLLFSNITLADSAYKELVDYSIHADFFAIRLGVSALMVISAFLIYFAFRENQLAGFTTAVVFFMATIPNVAYVFSLVQALSIFLGVLGLFILTVREDTLRYVSLVFFAIALFISYPHFLYAFDVTTGGFALPIAFLLMGSVSFRIIYLIAGLVLMYLYPPLSLASLAFASGFSLTQFLKDFSNKKQWLLFLVVFFIFLFSSRDTSLNTVLIGGFVAFIIFGLVYLYSSSIEGFATSFLFVILLSSIIIGVAAPLQSTIRTPTLDHLVLYQSVDSPTYILEFPFAFKYYTGMEPNLLSREDLVEEKFEGAILASNPDLFEKVQNDTILFYYESSNNIDGQLFGTFVNRQYVLIVPMSGNFEFIGHGQLYSRATRAFISGIIFPYLKIYDADLQGGTMVMNTENSRNTMLYHILFQSKVEKQSGNVKLYRVE